MEKLLAQIENRFSAFTFTDALDIAVLGVIIFLLYRFCRHRRVFSICLGALVFVLVKEAFGALGLATAYKVMNAFCLPGILMIAIVFQADLRSALEALGASVLGVFKAIRGEFRPVNGSREADELVSAVTHMASSRTGAIIVIERSTGIEDICEQSVIIDAKISSDLLNNLFFSPAPLHDGAVVISGKRIHAAGCFLPSTAAPGLDPAFGSRHRAAIAMSKISDADIIVISEEDGKVSHAHKGELTVGIDEEELRAILGSHFGKIRRKH